MTSRPPEDVEVLFAHCWFDSADPRPERPRQPGTEDQPELARAEIGESTGLHVLVDVRHRDCVDDAAAQFDLTRRACAEVGWQYAVFTGLDPITEQNVRWLAGYRQDRCAPTDDAFTAIASCFAHPLPLGLGAHRVARSTGVSKDMALANVLHLLWRRQLSANLSTPLSLDSEVSA